MKPNQAQHDFIVRVGRWWETLGSRSAGRILGWLMICEPAHRSAAELIDELQLSSGSVSTQTSTLERVGFLERITFPGNRATYYRLRPNVWIDLMQSEQARLAEMKELAVAATDVMPEESPNRVEDLARVADFFLGEWPELMQRLGVHLEKEQVR